MIIVAAMKALNGEFLFPTQIGGNDLGVSMKLGTGEIEIKGIVFGVKVSALKRGQGKIGNAALGKIVCIKKRFRNFVLGPRFFVSKSEKEHARGECAAQDGDQQKRR